MCGFPADRCKRAGKNQVRSRRLPPVSHAADKHEKKKKKKASSWKTVNKLFVERISGWRKESIGAEHE